MAHEARRVRDNGRPVLIGSRPVEAFEHLSAALLAASMQHRVPNARQAAREAELPAPSPALPCPRLPRNTRA